MIQKVKLILTQLVYYSKKVTYLSEYQQFFSSQNYTSLSTLFQFILLVMFTSKDVRNFIEVYMSKARQENHVFNTWQNIEGIQN